MNSRIERRQQTIAATGNRAHAMRYFNAIMTSVLAVACIGEGLWLSRDPSFAIGAAAAGSAIAVGGLGLIAGVSWLLSI
jgi:hypothetical protein